ncbi:MAG: RNA polymerase subunit sigma-70, partial [Oscillospiraceae bacterium]|nr:RNA polymerase subunit sigma-70 [Oscillospiraceae bacterium]
MTDTQKAAALHLRSKGRSFAQIAAELDLSVNTVKSFCSRNKGSLLCLCCRTPIQQPKRTRQKKFCSDHCRMQWWNANSKEVNRKAMYEF